MVLLLLIPILCAADQPQLLTVVPLSKDLSSETKVPLDPHALVLVKIQVSKGDTLWKFAKRYLKRPHYFAQFLIYNQIKNPNRIYPGQSLWVPLGPVKDHPEVFSGQQVPRWIVLQSDLPAGQADLPVTRQPDLLPDHPAVGQGQSDQQGPQPPAVIVPTITEKETAASPEAPSLPAPDPAQVEFEQDLNLFNRGDYSTAAGRFESFLATYPDSPLRLRAEYYLAESYRLLEQEP